MKLPLCPMTLWRSILYTLINCLQSSDDHALLRGGIFFIGMVLWSDKPTNCPNCPPAVVLPALSDALRRSQHPKVVHETGLTMQKLIRLDGQNLIGLAWDWVLEILDSFLKIGDEHPKVREIFVEIVADIQELVDKGLYSGSLPSFLASLERGLPFLSESSVVLLMNFQADNIKPSQPNWIANLNKHVQR